MSYALRALAMAVATLVPLAAATAAEILVKVDSLPPAGNVVYPLQANSRIANRLTSPVDGTIVGVQIVWGSVNGTAAPSQQAAIRISAADPLPFNPVTPLATLATINAPILIDGGLNEFRFLDPATNLTPLAVPITAGTDFFVDLQYATGNSQTDPSIPGVLIDADGTQGLNGFYLNGPWFLYSLLIPGGGDVGIRAIIQPVPEPSTYALAAIGVAALLVARRRKGAIQLR